MNIKLYLAAFFAAAFAMRATMGDAPLPEDTAAMVAWVLNGIIAGLGFILGPEVMDGIRMAAMKSAKVETIEDIKVTGE